MVKIYLDNCSFNRPFDTQSQLRIRLETEAKLAIQEQVVSKNLFLVWSYILSFENSKNPCRERRTQIAKWETFSSVFVKENGQILSLARKFKGFGVKDYDSLHIACAIIGLAEYFITTDDGILNKYSFFKEIKIVDPIAYIKEMNL